MRERDVEVLGWSCHACARHVRMYAWWWTCKSLFPICIRTNLKLCTSLTSSFFVEWLVPLCRIIILRSRADPNMKISNASWVEQFPSWSSLQNSAVSTPLFVLYCNRTGYVDYWLINCLFRRIFRQLLECMIIKCLCREATKLLGLWITSEVMDGCWRLSVYRRRTSMKRIAYKPATQTNLDKIVKFEQN